jgi:hypothetical protein
LRRDDDAEGLYRLVDAAYEKRSLALSSNLHPAGFDELMPKTMATATIDRLLHQRRQRATDPSHGRQGGERLDLATHQARLVATIGQISRPRAGNSHDRQFLMSLDRGGRMSSDQGT